MVVGGSGQKWETVRFESGASLANYCMICGSIQLAISLRQ